MDAGAGADDENGPERSGRAGDVTRALAQVARGDSDARERLFALLYDELRRIAGAAMTGQSSAHTLQPTALVHEAYLRLVGKDGAAFADRTHFLSAAARAMRHVLVDHARAREALKRGGGALRFTLDEARDATGTAELEVLAVHDALARLEERNPDRGRVVELRFFGGLSVDDTASVLGISSRSVKRHWQAARVWLHREIAP